MSAGPQLLDTAALPDGWYLPREGERWLPVAEQAPETAAEDRCWWSPTEPPGDGWWTAPDGRERA